LIEVVEDESVGLEVDITNGAYIGSKIMTTTHRLYNHQFKVLLIEGPLVHTHLLALILKSITSAGFKNILIIAKEFSNEVINMIEINNRNGVSNIILTEAEGFSGSRLDILEDLSLVTDAKIMSVDNSTKFAFKDTNVSHLGTVASIIEHGDGIVLKYQNPEEFTNNTVITKHIEELHKSLQAFLGNNDPISNSRRNLIKTRLHKFTNLATIRVGGTTKTEMKERKDRLEDAVHAIAAAVEGGVVLGGGYTLYRAGLMIAESGISGVGNDILNLIILLTETPIDKLLKSSPISTTASIEEIKLKIKEDSSVLYDVKLQKFVPISDTIVLDPADVVIESLYNALSVTKMLLNSSGALILDTNV
jgi:chaperonin GroEL